MKSEFIRLEAYRPEAGGSIAYVRRSEVAAVVSVVRTDSSLLPATTHLVPNACLVTLSIDFTFTAKGSPEEIMEQINDQP